MDSGGPAQTTESRGPHGGGWRNRPPVNEDWARSNAYHDSFTIRPDEGLSHALENSKANDLPPISVSAAQGKLLKLIALSINARRILEVGTLGGYSTIWLAQALPEDGEIITCEISEKHAEVARANLEFAGQGKKVKVVVAPAVETLAKLETSFDFCFIDADKQSNALYFREAKRLVRKGGVIIVDNMVRNGSVANPDANDEAAEGVRALLRRLKGDTEVDATTITTLGDNRYDGFLYAVRL